MSNFLIAFGFTKQKQNNAKVLVDSFLFHLILNFLTKGDKKEFKVNSVQFVL